jgi:hypothetical protein
MVMTGEDLRVVVEALLEAADKTDDHDARAKLIHLATQISEQTIHPSALDGGPTSTGK